MKFREFCQSQGIDLLYDDLKFVQQCLGQLRPKDKHEALKRYCETWKAGIREGSQGIGRYMANTYLRGLISPNDGFNQEKRKTNGDDYT